MKSYLRMPREKISSAPFFLAVIFCLLFAPSYAEYSQSSRQTGEEVLIELLMGSSRFVASVGSNGCTDKDYFKVDVKKEAGLSEKAPHYVLTIIRAKADDCKEIVDGGTLVLFDLEKDLGIKGDFTYSVSNRVLSSSSVPPADNSLWSIIEKYFTSASYFPEIKEIRPEPYKTFVMAHDYFSCLIPARWKLENDKEGCEKAGIFEIKLTWLDKAKPEDGERYFFPDPLIYLGYYSKNNTQNKTYESFITDYETLRKQKQDSHKSCYEMPKDICFNCQEAQEQVYEVYQDVPRGPLFSIKYWLKAKFIVVKAKAGFYVLAYKSPKEFYDQYLPVFEEIVKSFKPASEGAVNDAEAAEAGKTSRYTIDGGYFSCDLPEGWAMSRNPEEDVEYGIYEIRLSGGKGPGGAEIVVSYYTPGNKDFTGFEDYVARNSKDLRGAVKTATSSYEPVKEIKLSGRPALELARERFMYLHPHEKSTEGISLKERIYVLPAKEGFYTLELSSPTAEFASHLPVFEKLAESFFPKL